MSADTIFATLFLASLLIIYVAVPLVIAYYLYKHKFMSDRLRYLFAAVLVFNVLFLVFLVVLDVIA